MNELVSIIIPIYNKESYITQCVDSVIAQTYTWLDIILVNDGSGDRSGKICDGYANKDSRIRVIHKKNGGLSDARNAGLDAAKGAFIFFLDADDYIEKNTISHLVERIQRENADVAITNFWFENPDGETWLPERMVGTKVWNREELFAALTGINNLPFVVAWNKLYRRQLWDTYRFPKGKIHEDEFAAHHILGQCTRAAMTEACLYHYVQREDSILATNTDIKRLDVLEAVCDRLRYIKENGLTIHLSAAADQLWDHYRHFYKTACGKSEAKSRLKEVKHAFNDVYGILMCISPFRFRNWVKYTLFRFLGVMKGE